MTSILSYSLTPIYEKGLYKIFAMMQVNVEKQTVKYSTIRLHILSRIKKNL